MRGLLITALVVLTSLLHTAPVYAGASYFLEITGEYFENAGDACKALTFDSESRWDETYSVTAQTEIGSVSYSGNYYTCSLRLYSPGGNYITTQGMVGGVLAKITANYCEAGGTQNLTWPIGREEVAIGDSSFSPFGFDLPDSYCFAGCKGTVDPSGTGQDFFGEPDTDPKYEIIFANVAYQMTGDGCASGTNEPPPDVPPPPDDSDPCEANPTAEGCTEPHPPTALWRRYGPSAVSRTDPPGNHGAVRDSRCHCRFRWPALAFRPCRQGLRLPVQAPERRSGVRPAGEELQLQARRHRSSPQG